MRASFLTAALTAMALTAACCTNEVESTPVEPDTFFDEEYFLSSTDTAVTGRASDVTYYSAELTGKLNIRSFNALPQFSTWGMAISATNSDPKPGGEGCSTIASKRQAKIFTCSAAGLSMGTRYYYRAYLREGRDKVVRLGRVMYFTTGRCEVRTEAANPVSIFSATLRGSSSVKLNDTKFKGEVGFLYTRRQTDRPNASVDAMIRGKVTDGDSVRFEATLSGLEPSTRYVFQAYMKIDTTYYWGDAISLTTTRLDISDSDMPVDLGLTTLWASRNVGATGAELAGTYFGWGDPTGELTTPDLGAYPTEASIVGTEYDMATANLGAGWQTPTFEQMKELVDQCDWAWTAYKGTQGYAVVSRTNGKAIFLPAAGYAKPGNAGRTLVGGDIADPVGYYWTGSISSFSRFAYSLKISKEKKDVHNLDFDRSYGYCVRPVLAN